MARSKNFGNEDESFSINAMNYAKSKHPPCEFDPLTNSTSGTLSKVKEHVTLIFPSIGALAPGVPRFGPSNVFCKVLSI